MVSIVGETWPGQTYSKIDSLSISANCSLRRVMTMRLQPPDTTDDDSKLVPEQLGVMFSETYLQQLVIYMLKSDAVNWNVGQYFMCKFDF